MKLACNYSPQLMDLLARGEAPVDFIKAGAFGPSERVLPEMLRLKPVLLHGLGAHERAGMPGYGSYDFARANALIRRCGSPHLAIHLAIRNADLGPGWAEEDIHRRMAACTVLFKEYLCVPLLLENTADTPEERTVYDLAPFVEPVRIRRVLEETGAGMLLDVTHAKVTAQCRNWNVLDYLGELPLGLVREIHVTGSGFDGGGAPYDAHGPMGEEDYALLEWTLDHTSPEIVTLEYGAPEGADAPEADPEILREQLARIFSMITGGQS